MKKVFMLTLALLQAFVLFAATKPAKYISDDYELYLQYNDIIVPGDAVFVRMTIETPKSLKLPKEDLEKQASLQLIKNKKVIEEATFYPINKTNKNHCVELLCGVPVSMWLEDDAEYTLKVVVSPYKDKYDSFNLPVTFKSRTFIEEVVELDESNTAIKTDNSPTRAKQIDKLNTILFTSMPSDVYTLLPFEKPVNCTRLTGFYGDRRIYKYSNGKQSYGNPHNGIDYGVPEGTPINSCAKGKVVMAENRISTGYSIVIEHLPGLYSLYYHLSDMNVALGDMVEKGQLIGSSGKTGLATGPHLHWEVRLNGSAVNPEFFLNAFAFEEEEK